MVVQAYEAYFGIRPLLYFDCSSSTTLRYILVGMIEPRSLPLDDDVLLLIFATLSTPDIVRFGQVCHRTWNLSACRWVWFIAYRSHILQKGIQIPLTYLESLSVSELKRQSIRAYLLERNMSSPKPQVLKLWTTGDLPDHWDARFVRAQGKTWILVLCLDEPPVLHLLDLTTSQIVHNYHLEGSVGDLIINTSPLGEAAFVVGTNRKGRSVIEFLSICEEDDTTVCLRCVNTLDCDGQSPIALYGDTVAFGLPSGLVVIRNWKTGGQLLLGCPNKRTSHFEYNRPREVVFLREEILVIRICSVHIFLRPPIPLISDCIVVEKPYKIASLTHGMSSVTDGAISFTSRSITFSFEPMLSYDQNTIPLLSTMLVQNHAGDEFQFFKVNDRLTHPRPQTYAPAPLFSASTSSSLSMQNITWPKVYHGPCGTAACLSGPPGRRTLTLVAFPGPYNETNEAQVKVKAVIGGEWHQCYDYDEAEGQMLVAGVDGWMGIFSLCPLA